MEAVAPSKKTSVPLYNVLTNKNGFEYKVANPDHPSVCPQTGIIIIEALKRNQLKQPRISFKKLLDPETGITYGIPMGIDNKTGELEFQRINLGDVVQFDLANSNDRKLWTVISRHESMMGSPFSRGIPKFKTVDKNKEADNVIMSSKSLVRAIQIASDMAGVELYDMAINMGLNPEHNNPALLMASVLEMAQKSPDGFLRVYDNTNRNVITVFNRARAMGLIKLDVASGFVWKDSYPLGANETLAIKTIVGNSTLLMQMDVESKQRSNYYKKHATKDQMDAVLLNKADLEANQKKTYQETDFVSAHDVKRVMNELDAEKQRTKELNDRMEAFLASQQNKPAEATTPIEKAIYDEFKSKKTSELQEEAFGLGYALARTTEDRELLMKKILKLRK
jgi:hypothetical protein